FHGEKSTKTRIREINQNLKNCRRSVRIAVSRSNSKVVDPKQNYKIKKARELVSQSHVGRAARILASTDSGSELSEDTFISTALSLHPQRIQNPPPLLERVYTHVDPETLITLLKK